MKSKIKLFPFIVILILLITACQNNQVVFQNNSSSFQISVPITLNEDQKVRSIPEGTIWYDEDNILNSGQFGAHWISPTTKEEGALDLEIFTFLSSPDLQTSFASGMENDYDWSIEHNLYQLSNHKYSTTEIDTFYYHPIFCDEKTICGTSWTDNARNVIVIKTNIETGEKQETSLMDTSRSADPLPQFGQNGILTYNWYQNYSKPRLVVYDMNKQEEVTYYEGINYQVRPSFFGYLLNPEGTRILSISDTNDGHQEELFGVEIGSEPIQITNFHETYPNFLIYNLSYGGNIWSPDNRWVVIKGVPGQDRYFETSIDPTYLFLVDLREATAYQIDENILGKGASIVWAPDSSMFVLSFGDQLWLIDPYTRKTQLLLENPDVPLRVLGWTNP